MTDKQPAPTLTDYKGMGGVIAQDGFEYQIWDGLARLPAWLVNPAFEGMIFEGLEDLEARFFAPLAPHGSVIDRHQAKSGVLKPADVKEIVERFSHYHDSYPDTARTHILVTPQIPATLAYMAKDRDRVRKARPFYDPFTEIKAQFDAKFRADVVAQYPDPLGGFVVDFVDFDERNIPDDNTARSLFAGAFHEAFPALDLKSSQLRMIFDDLLAMAKANHNIGSFLTRTALVQCIEAAMGESLPADLRRESRIGQIEIGWRGSQIARPLRCQTIERGGRLGRQRDDLRVRRLRCGSAHRRLLDEYVRVGAANT